MELNLGKLEGKIEIHFKTGAVVTFDGRDYTLAGGDTLIIPLKIVS